MTVAGLPRQLCPFKPASSKQRSVPGVANSVQMVSLLSTTAAKAAKDDALRIHAQCIARNTGDKLYVALTFVLDFALT